MRNTYQSWPPATLVGFGGVGPLSQYQRLLYQENTEVFVNFEPISLLPICLIKFYQHLVKYKTELITTIFSNTLECMNQINIHQCISLHTRYTYCSSNWLSIAAQLYVYMLRSRLCSRLCITRLQLKAHKQLRGILSSKSKSSHLTLVIVCKWCTISYHNVSQSQQLGSIQETLVLS